MKFPRNGIDDWIVASVPAPENKDWGYYQGWTPCIEWCKDRVTATNWRFVGEGVFEFRRADDYMMFLLKWA